MVLAGVGPPLAGGALVGPAPIVSAITPRVGPTSGGTIVTISGAHLGGTTKVTFGTALATAFSVVDADTVVATAPARAAGVVPVKVTTAGGSSAAVTAARFSFVGVPVVKTVAPAVGGPEGGTAVTITGTGFTGATSVAFGGVPAPSTTVVSATKLTTVTPPHAVGVVDVTVTGVAGTSASGSGSRYTYASVPAVSSLTPNRGRTSGGETVTIRGTGFTGATAVKFAPAAASSFAVVDDATIVATSPAHSAGVSAVSVTTPRGKTAASAVAKFTYVAPPTVSAVTRRAGLASGGSVVTISGTLFAGATAVTFGGVPAASFTVSSTKKITAVTPAHAAGLVDVAVVTEGGPNPAGPAATFLFHPLDGRAADGRTSLFVGQELGAVGGFADFDQGYADYVGAPAGVTIYTDIRYPNALAGRLDLGSGVLCGQCYLDNPRFDRSMIAIGLYMVDDLPNVVSGARDANITTLGNFIKQADRPVFLRIGYEFDGSWNHYNPTQYVQAFRRIMDRLHAQGVTNVVAVWQSSGYTTNPATLMQWYPGDDYVDWAAYSYFNQSNPSLGMLGIARDHGKPVMIAEATPKRNLSLGDAVGHWNAWFAGFFQHIHANQDVIKAVAYINTRWFDQPAWTAGWGDSRVQIRPEIKSRWVTEMQTGIWDPGELDRIANTYVLTPHDLTPP
jgi:hypothetical protein